MSMGTTNAGKSIVLRLLSEEMRCGLGGFAAHVSLRKMDQRNERIHRYGRNDESITCLFSIPRPGPTPAASTNYFNDLRRSLRC